MKNNHKNHRFTAVTILPLLLAASLATGARADDGRADSFAFVGGSLATFKDDSYGDNSHFGFGADALYLKKVWGGLSLGVNANVTFGLEKSNDLAFNNGTRNFSGEAKETLTVYTVSLVLGGISEFDSGGRLAYFAGPTIGGRSGDYDVSWEPDAAAEGLTSHSSSDSDTLYGLTAGAYYKFPGSGWTVGVNASGYFVADEYDDYVFSHRLGLSVGYSF
ncbi:outer membrane beta-barrel protein [Emcibacter nanhaiensis]|uniref:outer membrane beta-barrel protein n=1 Tax=Emcibacter nanhaiensis TaxID=1505037 RepID=UPI0015E32B9E|nr:outer membrane beta-barrel protein [Emcibacter nanhaiensis]